MASPSLLVQPDDFTNVLAFPHSRLSTVERFHPSPCQLARFCELLSGHAPCHSIASVFVFLLPLSHWSSDARVAARLHHLWACMHPAGHPDRRRTYDRGCPAQGGLRAPPLSGPARPLVYRPAGRIVLRCTMCPSSCCKSEAPSISAIFSKPRECLHVVLRDTMFQAEPQTDFRFRLPRAFVRSRSPLTNSASAGFCSSRRRSEVDLTTSSPMADGMRLSVPRSFSSLMKTPRWLPAHHSSWSADNLVVQLAAYLQLAVCQLHC